MKDFTREELWDLETRARYWGETASNPYWITAYRNLDQALNTLDAFIARSSTGVPKVTISGEGAQSE